MLTDDAPDRADVFAALRADGIGVNVHYRPLHLHTSFRNGSTEQRFPVAEDAYARLLSLPMWHGLQDGAQDRVLQIFSKALRT
jgi:perosamine synthetase